MNNSLCDVVLVDDGTETVVALGVTMSQAMVEMEKEVKPLAYLEIRPHVPESAS